jgi:hypothetical protein
MMLASNGYTTSINAGVMTPEDLRSIDEKMDDGAASTGTVRSTKNVAAGSGFQNGCVNGSNAYDTTLATSVCVPVFIAGF